MELLIFQREGNELVLVTDPVIVDDADEPCVPVIVDLPLAA